jgi:hypothetical protein
VLSEAVLVLVIETSIDTLGALSLKNDPIQIDSDCEHEHEHEHEHERRGTPTSRESKALRPAVYG